VVDSDRFFVRKVALLPGEPLSPQIKLALEGMSPFPPEQLYFGSIPASDGASALVYGAYRRRFTANEIEGWDTATLVAPEFVALCEAPSNSAAGFIRLHTSETRLTALAWLPGELLPSFVISRTGAPADADALVAEIRDRSGLPAETGVQVIDGLISGQVNLGGVLSFTAGDTTLPAIPSGWQETADIRDPAFLAARRRAAVRDLWLWRALIATAALLALAAMLEVSATVLRWQAHRREAQVKQQAPIVEQIDTAQALANRIGELSEKRLMPFEMLSAINPSRPDSIVFQRTITRGLRSIEIEAQAGNAEDVSTYATALKALPALAEVKTREVRSRDGVTSFVLALEFKADAFRKGGSL
jgi:hypothetical protein